MGMARMLAVNGGSIRQLVAGSNSLIPPSQSQTINGTPYVVTIDSLIGNGSIVDFDPDHDPFFASAAARSYGLAPSPARKRERRLHLGHRHSGGSISRAVMEHGVNTSTNVLNIKSGSLWFINGDGALNTNNPPYPNLGTASSSSVDRAWHGRLSQTGDSFLWRVIRVQCAIAINEPQRTAFEFSTFVLVFTPVVPSRRVR